MLTGTWHAAAQDRGVRLGCEDGTAILNGSVQKDLNIPANRTYKSTIMCDVVSLGSESIYTNTCQFEVRDQCFCTHFTRKGDHSRQHQITISAYIAE